MVQEFPSRLSTPPVTQNRSGERRIITALFCDVAGSTALAEHFDPEDWADIMNEAFEYMNRPVYRYGGTVARLMGDGILALFGAPFAHEDDPERAVLAGLAILEDLEPFRKEFRRDHGLDFDVRVGINTGPVVVGDVGSAEVGEYTAMGDAVNLAARMEQTAQPGTLQVSADTYRLVAPLFEFEPLGGIEVKGKSAPVAAYRVICPKERPGSLRGIEGVSAPLVGRDAEFATLRRALHEVREGRGQIVFLTGEAGLGKSRLIEDLHAEWMKMKGDESSLEHWSWTVSRGISYDSTRPYGLFINRTRQLLGIEEGASPEAIRQRIEELAQVYPDYPSKEVVVRAVEALMAVIGNSNGAAVEGETLKNEVHQAIPEAWRVLTQQIQVVMVFDDLHWADPASVDLLLQMFKLVDESPILFLCTTRPERQSAGWKLKQAAETEFTHRYKEIALTPLSNEDSDTLIDSLIHIADLPPHIHQAILDKTEGNPLFVEEVVRSLIDNGAVVRDEAGAHWYAAADIDDIAIPESLQALLLTRIDRLEEPVRYTLQMASVIGRTFYFRILKMVSDSTSEIEKHLNTLQRFDLIRESARVPELEYTFRHELTREAAYNSILRRRCRIFHRRVGEAIETLYAGRLKEEAYRLAYHYQEAGDDERAFKYSTLAGDAAARVYANTEAAMHYTNALDIAGRTEVSSEQLTHLYVGRGWALHSNNQFDEALANYRELEELGRKRGDPRMELAALLPQATVHSIYTMQFDPEKGRSLSTRALDLARNLNDPSAEAKALWNLMLVDTFSNRDAQRALSFGEQSLAIARKHNLKSEMAYTLNDIARPYFAAGKPELAMAALEESRELWRELDNKPMLADNLSIAADAYLQAGDLEKAYETAQEALSLSQSIGNLWGEAASYFSLAPIYCERGEFQDAIDALDTGMPISEKANFVTLPTFIQVAKGWLYGNSGDLEYALELVRPGLETMEGAREVQTFARGIAAKLHLLGGNLEQASKLVEDIRRSFEESDVDEWGAFSSYARPFLVTVKIIMGEVDLTNGQYDEVIALVNDTLTRNEAVGMRLLAPDLLRLKGQALLGLGRRDEAHEILEQALAEAERQCSRRSLWAILYDLSQIEEQLDNPTRAESLRAQARDVVGYIADHIDSHERRDLFFSLSQIREIIQAR